MFTRLHLLRYYINGSSFSVFIEGPSFYQEEKQKKETSLFSVMGHLLKRNVVRRINIVVWSKTSDLYSWEWLECQQAVGAGTSKRDFTRVGEPFGGDESLHAKITMDRGCI